MKRIVLSAAVAAAGLAALAALRQAPATPSLTRALAPGALLVLEARDFSSLVAEWNQSERKRLWLQSDNYAVFSRSRLLQRLGDVQQEYAAAAGFAPDFSLVEMCAGKESVLGLYSIANTEFLYMTRTSAADVMQKVMARSNSKYEPRESAGQPYLVRTDKQSGRQSAFASFGDVLLVASREDLIASALAALKGEARASVDDEGWYARCVKAAGTPGELRLVMNLEALVKTPHFRSYWIQRNGSEIRQYAAAIADLNRHEDRVEERRMLFRAQAIPVSPDAGRAGQMLALVPEAAGFYRAASEPVVDEVVDRLARKLIDPGPGQPAANRLAPAAADPDATLGSPSDLETRIDERPLKRDSRANLDPVRQLLNGNHLLAELEIGATATLPDGVFLEPRQTVALLGRTAWNASAARAAFPDTMTVQAKGALLVMGRDPQQVKAMTEQSAGGRPVAVSYAAGFRFHPEFDRLMNLFQLLEEGDSSDSYQSQPGGPAAPRFFSGNLASLGRTLLKMDSASITIRELGERVEEQVQYRLAP